LISLFVFVLAFFSLLLPEREDREGQGDDGDDVAQQFPDFDSGRDAFALHDPSSAIAAALHR